MFTKTFLTIFLLLKLTLSTTIPLTPKSPPLIPHPVNSGYIITSDDTQIFYKDLGPPSGQPILFSHGWPLSSTNWEKQMYYLSTLGYRTIAHDRRGHGFSSQPWAGNDMNTYASDLSTLIQALDLHNVTLVGHSTGGGEIVRYMGQYGTSRITSAVLVSSVTPYLLQTPSSPWGVPLSIFNGFRSSILKNRAQFFVDVPSTSFYNFNLPNVTASQGLINEWFNQGMQAGFKAAYDCVAAFSETDFRGDMMGLEIPVLLVHGTEDMVVPINASAKVGVGLLKKGVLKEYIGAPHGVPNVRGDELNRDLEAWIKNGSVV